MLFNCPLGLGGAVPLRSTAWLDGVPLDGSEPHAKVETLLTDPSL